MRRKLAPAAPHGLKDDSGAYLPPQAPSAPPESHAPSPGDTDLDELLGRQLLALDRVSRQLALRASSGDMTKDEIQSLSTCIKVTMDLKAKQNELLDNLTEEELKAASSNDATTKDQS